MPSSSKRGKKERGSRSAASAASATATSRKKSGLRDGVMGSDDDSVYNDDASVVSLASEGSLVPEDAEDAEDFASEQMFEEKLKEALDLATQKSANGRVKALQELCKAFTKKFVPDFLEDRFLTVSDIIERALKKGKAGERVVACNLSILVCLQLGTSTSSENVYKALRPIFLTILNDESASVPARVAVAHAFGAVCFIAGEEIAEFVNIMEIMEKVYSSSSKKNADILPLHNACLSSWTLLLTMIPSSHAYTMLDSYIGRLEGLLDSSDVDLRITSGEAIVVLYEISALHDENEAFLKVQGLCGKLKELSTDSNKHRSKKDRKEQRSSFRDILKTIETGTDYYERISINSRETLSIDSWSKKKHYDVLCKTLLSGINLHLTENELVRDIFELGSPIPSLSNLQSNKPSKHQRQLVNSQAFKFRTQTRGKERDKRNAIV